MTDPIVQMLDAVEELVEKVREVQIDLAEREYDASVDTRARLSEARTSLRWAADDLDRAIAQAKR